MKKLILIGLGILLSSCVTDIKYIYISPDIMAQPEAPVMGQPKFTDTGKGLALDYDQFRVLQKNIIDMKTYSEKLKVIVDFYEKSIKLIQDKNKINAIKP